MNLTKISLLLPILLMLVAETTSIQENTGSQLHRYYDNDPYYHGSGMSKFAAIIIGIIAGVLCFLGILYYFKWRRETGGHFSFFDMFTRRTTVQTQPQYGYHPQQGGAHYVSNPNEGAPGYYNSNPNYPNYPPL